MTICAITGFSCVCQPDQGVVCPYHPLVRDAGRYRWLREQNWMDSEFCVARVKDFKVGTQTYTHDRLDEAIDAALAPKEPT